MQLSELERIIGITLDDWQREFVLAEEPHLILCMGRKSGKSLSIAVKIAYDAVNNDFSKTDGICILSRGQRQSRELFLQARAILCKLGYKFTKWGSAAEGEGTASMTQLTLPNGNKIYSLPCGYDGVTIRYYSFWKLFRDEDAFIPDAVDTAVSACLAVHGVQEIRTSTPFGTHGSFYNAWHSGNWRMWHRTTYQCPRVLASFLARKKKELTKAEFAQEYLAEFTETAEGIYPTALVAPAMKRDIDWGMLQKTATLFLGVDFARFGDDENVIAMNYFKEGISHIKIKIIQSKFRTTHIAGAAKAIADSNPNFRLLVTDEGGIGAGATDMLIEALGKRKVIGLANQQRVVEAEGTRGRYMKADLHLNLIKLLELGRVVFDDDIAIVRSLRSMKYLYTKAGDLTITGRDSHAAEAIVRAVFPVMNKRMHTRLWLVGMGESALNFSEDNVAA